MSYLPYKTVESNISNLYCNVPDSSQGSTSENCFRTYEGYSGDCAIYTGYSGNYETKLLQSWENMVVSNFYVNTFVGLAIILMCCIKTSIVVQLKTGFGSTIVTAPPHVIT